MIFLVASQDGTWSFSRMESYRSLQLDLASCSAQVMQDRIGKAKMERNLSLVSLALLCSLAIISWPALNAEEAKSKSTETNAETVATISKLLDRIETLEQRIDALEQQQSAVRLVDSRDEFDVNVLPQIVPKEAKGTGVAQPPADLPSLGVQQVPFTPTAPIGPEKDEDTQETNGMKWRFHLLRNRTTTSGANKIY